MKNVGKYIIHETLWILINACFLDNNKLGKKTWGARPFSIFFPPSKIPIVYRCCEAEEPGAWIFGTSYHQGSEPQQKHMEIMAVVSQPPTYLPHEIAGLAGSGLMKTYGKPILVSRNKGRLEKSSQNFWGGSFGGVRWLAMRLVGLGYLEDHPKQYNGRQQRVWTLLMH